jgi:hypothetical protein
MEFLTYMYNHGINWPVGTAQLAASSNQYLVVQTCGDFIKIKSIPDSVHCSLTHRIVIFMRRQTNLKYSTFSTNFCVLFTTINYIKILVDDYFIPVSYKRPFIIKLNYSHYLRIRFPFTNNNSVCQATMNKEM